MWAYACVLVAALITSVSGSFGRILGGNNSFIEEHPYILQLEIPDGSVCAATVIDEMWAVTAAQCTVRNRLANITVRARSTFLGVGGFVIPIVMVIPHPCYQRDSLGFQYSDISLLKSKTSFYKLPGFAIFPAKLPDLEQSYLQVGTPVTTLGWGWDDVEEGTPSRWLQQVDLQLSWLQSLFHKCLLPTFVRSSQGQKMAQPEDCGGPALYGDVLVGVTSFSYTFPLVGYLTVFTRIKCFVPWILHNIRYGV